MPKIINTHSYKRVDEKNFRRVSDSQRSRACPPSASPSGEAGGSFHSI